MKKNYGTDRIAIEDGLRSIIVDFARSRPNRVKRSTRVREELGIDSFTALEILVAVENKFAIKIKESELDKFITFGDVADFLCKKLSLNSSNGSPG